MSLCYGLSSINPHPAGSRPLDCPECPVGEVTTADDGDTVEVAFSPAFADEIERRIDAARVEVAATDPDPERRAAAAAALRADLDESVRMLGPFHDR